MTPDTRSGQALTKNRQLAVSTAGREFDPAADSWTLDKDVTVKVGHVLQRLAPHLRNSYRKVLAHYAVNYASRTCLNINFYTLMFLKNTSAAEFSETALMNYRGQLDRKTEWRLAIVRPFLMRWHRLGYEGVTEKTADFLASLRLKGNVKGAAVKSNDPIEGPFDDQELAAILTTSSQMYEKGELALETLAFVLLISHTGRRPGQLSLLRLGDLARTVTTDGRSIEVVRIPRAKQRGEAPRTQFKSFWLSPDAYRVLEAQRDAVTESVQARFGPLPGRISAELPLFPDWSAVMAAGSIEELHNKCKSDSLHAATDDLTNGYGRIRVTSNRTGARLHIHSDRFRYTIGSEAARLGYGDMVIAELLDHSDTQNVKVYTRDHPNFRQKLDQAVGSQLAPVAKAFAGKIVDRESEARHGGDPSKRVGTRSQKTGTCGSSGFCGAEARACYTCMHFQAWMDGPHHLMLETLLAERQEMLDSGVAEVVVEAIDRNVAAVQAVMAACNDRKTELAEANHG